MAAPTNQHSSAAPALSLEFDDVYAENLSFVWRSVRGLGVHPPTTDDVVQEVFMVVYRKLNTFSGPGSVRPWLYAIARRVVSSHRRSARRRPQFVAEQPGDAIPSGSKHDPLTHVSNKEVASVLQTFLEALPEEQREVFLAVEVAQMSAPEAAEALAKNLNTVYSRLRLARVAFERFVARHSMKASQ